METIILASGSPRRQELLTLLGLPFTCMPSDIDESFDQNMEPARVAEELAIRKVKRVLQKLEDKELWVLGADTIIAMDGLIYGKPGSLNEARDMLNTFRGKTHEVISAIALYSGKSGKMDSRSCRSLVTFAAMTGAEIEWYLDTGEWEDAAGAYKIQGLASCFIKHLEGSYSSVMGLPLRDFYVMLRENDYPFGA